MKDDSSFRLPVGVTRWSECDVSFSVISVMVYSRLMRWLVPSAGVVVGVERLTAMQIGRRWSCYPLWRCPARPSGADGLCTAVRVLFRRRCARRRLKAVAKVSGRRRYGVRDRE